MRRGVRGAAALTICLVAMLGVTTAWAGTDVGAPGFETTTPASSDFVSYGGIRLRAIGLFGVMSDELLGVGDLDTATDRIEMTFTGAVFATSGNDGSKGGDCGGNYTIGTLASPRSNDVRVAWDPIADTLTSRFTSANVDCSLVFRNVARELANANGWTLVQARTALTHVNALRVSVDNRSVGASVALRQMTVDGAAIGSFGAPQGTAKTWLVGGYDFDDPDGFAARASLDLGGAFGSCLDTCAVEILFGRDVPPNEPPAVQVGANDVSGDEGSALATEGAFSDPDGDALAITKTSGGGDLVDHGDGTWSWSAVPDDDGSGSVTVEASDRKGGTATDTFQWSSQNVAPTIVSLTPSATTVLANADVTWSAVASDPGTADTHVWSFDGGLGSGTGLSTTFTRSYPGCGSYAIEATVTDDDGGSDVHTSSSRVTVAEANVVAPMRAGVDNVVRAGQVVPVKVWVGCGGQLWSGLAPMIQLVRDDGAGLAAVSSADTPGVMREVGGMYLYNLRVPRSADRHLIVRVRPLGPSGGVMDLALAIR